MRRAALNGQPRPEGLAALRFHGMVRGLAALLRATPPAAPAYTPSLPCTAMPRDPQLVRLLANIVLRTQAEVTHVF